MFSDEGITGTSTKNRDGFNQMIDLALSGGIDLILTKSISRFARNTVDTLQAVRKLKAVGVEVIFEKENLHTLDPKCEMILTIFSSLAQEESRSMSENIRWGHRKVWQTVRSLCHIRVFWDIGKEQMGDLRLSKRKLPLCA